MRGYRFYLDYGTATRRNKGQHKNQVIATRVKSDGRRRIDHITRDVYYIPGPIGIACPEIVALKAAADGPYAPIIDTTIPREYLDKCCKYISEPKAREYHPKLFEHLDALPAITRKPQQS